MEDDGPDIRTLIVESLNECNDMELLDLIYKLLITSNQ
jgi:hypothetical protein